MTDMPEQLTREDISRMSPAQIAQATTDGRPHVERRRRSLRLADAALVDAKLDLPKCAVGDLAVFPGPTVLRGFGAVRALASTGSLRLNLPKPGATLRLGASHLS